MALGSTLTISDGEYITQIEPKIMKVIIGTNGLTASVNDLILPVLFLYDLKFYHFKIKY